jgi:acetyltransferase
VKKFKKGHVALIIQSGGVTSQSAYSFSEEHIGFSKIISVGNKLKLGEIAFMDYLADDDDTHQIHLYLESIDNGRGFMEAVRRTHKPVVVFKSNVTDTASTIARSHTAALSNDYRVVTCALKQAGVVSVGSIHDMTVCARALQLPPLRGNRLLALSLSGGFAVILGDACEEYGFTCPALPRDLLSQIEKFRRGRVIRMSNPMDFGDVHNVAALVFTLESCLALDQIDGIALSFMYEPGMQSIFGDSIQGPEGIQKFLKRLGEKYHKPIALSFFAEKGYLEDFRKVNLFPVFSDPLESIKALRMLRDYWQGKDAHPGAAAC